ncbi:hypothetical protein FHU36_006973 [Nonomuraea muscovyensis]|uniref:Uncharacterized protein n=1 Tax=Nonomuraea muscovyensis TaxID=1124761 RepID=A0A7X0CA08_9ACTN|nr:hypothetical protein [Nonomuraea muscovyensis]
MTVSKDVRPLASPAVRPLRGLWPEEQDNSRFRQAHASENRRD